MVKQILHQIDDNTCLIKMPLRTLVQEIEDWDENRVLSESKVAEILNSYKKRDIALITSLFRSVVYPCGRQVLLDGHHRKEAAKEFLKEFKDFNENIDIFLVKHTVASDDSEDIYDLHIKSNLCKPLERGQIPNFKRTALIKAFKANQILKNGISSTRTALRAQQPKISLNELAELAGEISMKYPEMPTELIIYNIKDINHRLSLMFTVDNLSNMTLKGQKIKPEILEKANKIKFYLNIRDSKFNKDNWINFIGNPSDISIVMPSI